MKTIDDHIEKDKVEIESAKADGNLGKVRHLTKFYSNHNRALSEFAARHADGNFTLDAHPESIFMRHMWHPKLRIEMVNSKPRLRVLP